MTASEMFEELGYKRSSDIDVISYIKRLNGTLHFFEIMFDLLEKEIVIDDDYETSTITIDDVLLQAIDKQAEELGWLNEKTCTNLSEYDSMDEFKCSNCGFTLVEHKECSVDEDDGEEYYFAYKPKYCPNCGRKIVD